MAGEDIHKSCLVVKWSGNEYSVNVDDSFTVLDLKKEIKNVTGVLPERQKIMGMKFKGKPPDDTVLLTDMKLKPNTKLMMMGTREEELDKVKEPPPDLPEVINDFDIEEDEIAIENREEYLAKIERRVKDYKIEFMNEPRPGKKLLVLDIDYTLFDHRSVAEQFNELIRPFLHEFLQSAYEHYDIVIWSATSMKWIEVKMKELGCTSNPNYKLCFMLDSSAMISVHTPKYGVIEVKPLGVIWGKYKQWDASNTIMFDDIRRNFIMNPKTGLRIRAFREAHMNRHKDTELLKLSKYLKDISNVEDFTELNHKYWERYRPKRKHDKTESDDAV
ncbi:ubiquitin-like domain-containing CTD phosphatase 1 [Mytilus edulis]|uniref:ubiquitin-like domain-containing CTD phosphatase 1 n=1 Tax=Mytilus edulis TaxID=6550 RepID=UPI0039F1162C